MKQATPFVYQRVKGALLDMIESGGFGPGDKLPSERQLAKQLGCNFHTVRKGLAILEKEQIIERRVGAGTFLRQHGQTGTQVMDVPGAADRSGPAVRTAIGVICPLTTGSFGSEFLHHLHREVERRGYQLVIRAVSDYGASARKAAEEFVDQGCSAILLPLLDGGETVQDVWQLVPNIPIPVVISRPIAGLEKHAYERPEVYGRPTVAAVELACRYFQALGYEHIAFFGGDFPEFEDLQRRVLAYTRFMSRESLPTHMVLVGPTAQEVDAVVNRWMAMKGKLAVIAWGDEYAVRLMTSLHKHNVRIPQEVAVLGFGDIPLARTTDPPLSTIRFGYDYVVRAMLDRVEALSRGESTQADGNARQTLVIRESCGGRLRAGDKLAGIIEQAQQVCNGKPRE